MEELFSQKIKIKSSQKKKKFSKLEIGTKHCKVLVKFELNTFKIVINTEKMVPTGQILS